MQSNYIPWKGYFDLMNTVDDFVIYDTVQYTKNDWRNRNKIKSKDGVKWLTIPVETKGGLNLAIKDVKVSGLRWQKKHWSTLRQSYTKAAYIAEYAPQFERFYRNNRKEYLSEINWELILVISQTLGIDTRIHFSDEFRISGTRSEKLVGICRDLGAEVYVTGPAASDYLDVPLFTQEGITVEWMDYSGYPDYAQLFPPIEHRVSIVDLIFNEGANSTRFMKSFP